jgi:hypothetical protein
MDGPVEQLRLVLDLEARHDDLLDRLAELDKRVLRVLEDCQRFAKGASEPANPTGPAIPTVVGRPKAA